MDVCVMLRPWICGCLCDTTSMDIYGCLCDVTSMDMWMLV